MSRDSGLLIPSLCLRLRAVGSRERTVLSIFLSLPQHSAWHLGLTWLNECAPLVLQPQGGGLPYMSFFTQLLPPGVSQGALHMQGHSDAISLTGASPSQPTTNRPLSPLATALRCLPTHIPPSKYLTIYARTLILWSKNVLSRCFIVMS